MKYLKLKFLLMFFALAMAIPPAWAAEETVVFSEQGYTNGDPMTEYTGTIFSITFDEGTGNNVPKYYDSGTAIRLYGGNYMTVTSQSKITEIIITFGSSDGTNGISTNVGTYKKGDGTGTWTGSANSVKFTVNGTSGNRRIASVTVTTEGGGETPTTVATPTFSPAAGTYTNAQNVEINCETDGATIYYTTDGSTPTTSSTEFTSAITVSETMTIKAIAVKEGMNNSAVASATYSLPSGIIYKKVNSSTLINGGTYVIIYEGDPATAMGELVNKKGSPVTGIILDKTTNPYEVDLAGKNALFLTARAVGNDGNYAFEVEPGSYLNINSADFNITTTPNVNTAQWTVVGDGRVYNVSAPTRFICYRAGSSNVFGPYVSSNINNTEYFYAYLYEKVSSDPYITVEPEDGLTINDATGDNVAKTGTLTPTLYNGQGDLTATTSSSVWSWNNNTATFAGYSDDNGNKIYLPLHDEATVTFSSTGANDVVANLEYNYTGPLYILGTVNGWTSWGANNAVEIAEPDANGIYTVTLTTAAGEQGKSWISFSKRIAENNDDGGWAYIAPYRFSLQGENVNTAYWLTEDKINTWIDLDFDPDHAGNQPLRMDPGTYTITIDAKNNKFKIEKASQPSETMTFVKVTSDDQLKAGQKYIFVRGTAAMGPIVDGFGSVVTITAGDEVEAPAEIALTLGGTSGAWTLQFADGNYVTAGNSTGLGAGANATNWVISDVTESNVKGYRAKHASYNRAIRKHASMDRFGNYGTGDENSNWAWIYVEKTGDSPVETVATPTFDPDGASYNKPQTVTVSCTTEGATIRYTTDGTDPDANSATYSDSDPIVVNETMTIKAIAMKDGMNSSSIASATYTLPQTVNSLAEANALTGTGDNLKFMFGGEVVVTYHNGNYTWLRDKDANAGGGLIYQNNSNNPTPVTAQGHVYKPYWYAEKTTYQGLIEFQNAANIEDSNTTAAYTPYERTGALTDANMNEYIKLNNLMIKSVDGKNITATAAGENREAVNYNLYNQFDVQNIEVNRTYNVTGVVTKHSTTENDVQVYPTAIELVKQDPKLAFAEETVNATYGADFTEPELTKPEGVTVKYSSENTEVAEVNETTGEVTIKKIGNAKITATSVENEYYTVGTASYNIVVTAATPTFAYSAATASAVFGQTATLPTLSNPNNLTVTYTSSNPAVATVNENGEVTIKGAGKTTITANGAATGNYGAATASYELTVNKGDAGLSFSASTADAVVGSDFTEPTLSNPNGLTVTYTSSNPEVATVDVNGNVTIVGEGTTTITAKITGDANYEDAEVSYELTVAPQPVVAAPTFSLVAGTYGKAQQLTITAENGANILYSTDGSEPTTPYNGAISLGEGTTTVKAVATKDGFAKSTVVTATYIIDIPKQLPTITPFKGYYQIKNNGNGKYANIAGRKTLNFTDAENAKKMAGTVIWLETNDKGQVQSIRSQAADLQGYANRAMRYVPQMVDIVVNKINEMEGIEDATGAGSVLGETGLDAIMEKFNECFDYHLYVEEAQGGWRLYGKTPNMQHVVDFYRDYKDQVEAKLPKLEKFINDALHKLINKIGGSTVFTDFSLRQIWENMGGNLPEPVVGDDAAIMDFYRAVLNNKNYVWDFAYQTAQIYWGNVKSHPRYEELKAQLGEYADYIDEFVTQVRPDFKYYVIQRGDEPDYISEGNGEIISNDPRTLWTLEPRTDFTVNIAGEQFGCPYAGGVGGYATTNYTDFAYTVPEGVTAYKVASVENGVANLQALSGVIPAQTPVLLMAKTAGDYVLKLSTEAGTKVTGNLLVGVDSLITRFQLKTPMVESLFSLAKGVLGEQLYNQYVAQYEYLQLLYAGTVNNKYFWGLTRDDVMKCLNANGDDCVVRDLSGSKFIDNRQVKTNKAFLVSETDQTITISTLRGDVNHDGYVNIDDVTALIDYLLEVDGRACPYCANVNCDSTVNIVDVTYLIDILLGNISPYAEGGNGN